MQILESQITEKKAKVGKEIERVKEYKMTDPRTLAIRAMAEIRGQLALQLEIFKTLYDVKAVAEFQSTVLRIIEQVDRRARDAIIRELHR